MITFSALMAIVLTIAAIAVVIALVCGTGLIAVFGDLFIFGLIIWGLMKLFRRRK